MPNPSTNVAAGGYARRRSSRYHSHAWRVVPCHHAVSANERADMLYAVIVVREAYVTYSAYARWSPRKADARGQRVVTRQNYAIARYVAIQFAATQ